MSWQESLQSVRFALSQRARGRNTGIEEGCPACSAAFPAAGSKRLKRVHIIGRKNSGKTTLIVELAEYLCQRGLRLGTIKHTHHRHELDTPGKDSHRHRLAGAEMVAVMSPEVIAVYRRNSADAGDDRYSALEAAFADCDLVLVEGDVAARAPKVEVWRRAVQEAPYANMVGGIAAVITDDQIEGSSQVWPRHPIALLAELILTLTHT